MTTPGDRPTSKSLRFLKTQESKTPMLPPEMLSRIFQEVVYTTTVPGFDVDDSRTKHWPPIYPILILTNVCWWWRKVALSTPQLWMDICINFSSPDILPKCQLLAFYLQNSGTFIPLELCLYFKPTVSFNNYRMALLHPSVDDLIRGVLGRITWLRLLYPVNPSAWLSLTPQLLQLKGLGFDARCQTHIDSLDLSNSLPLSHLSLSSLKSEVSLPGGSITYLYLESVPISTCLYLLFHCPNLESYEMSNPHPKDNIPSSFSDIGAITLPRLKSLKWEYWGNGNSWDSSMLRRIHVPALESLVWEEHELVRVREIDADVVSFFRRLPTSLDCITIQTPVGTRAHLSLLSRDLKIRHMRLEFYEPSSFRDSLIRHLKCTTANGQITVPFPKLESLTIEVLLDDCWPIGGRDSVSLFRALAYRGAVLDTVMVLELFGCKITWPEGPMPPGRTDKIVVRENGEVPDWCQIVAPGMRRLSDSLPHTEYWL